MSQYCDTKILEKNWFNWLVSSSVPCLEPYRRAGVLWTKVTGTVKDEDGEVLLRHGKPLADPSHPTRSHCIALGHPVYLNSHQGVLDTVGTVTVDGKTTSIDPTDLIDELHLQSDAWIHNLNNPLSQYENLPHIEVNGYFREVPKDVSWHAMLEDINNICLGIAMKFNQPTEEEKLDLSNEALLQVTKKLVAGKLVYKPGKAPVFNLLTTTIHRCMFSIMNRRTNRKQGQARLLEEAQAGILPDSQRSLRTPTRRTIRSY